MHFSSSSCVLNVPPSSLQLSAGTCMLFSAVSILDSMQLQTRSQRTKYRYVTGASQQPPIFHVILSHLNPVHIPRSCFPKIHFNIILSICGSVFQCLSELSMKPKRKISFAPKHHSRLWDRYSRPRQYAAGWLQNLLDTTVMFRRIPVILSVFLHRTCSHSLAFRCFLSWDIPLRWILAWTVKS
jgi:hypothetical protein